MTNNQVPDAIVSDADAAETVAADTEAMAQAVKPPYVEWLWWAVGVLGLCVVIASLLMANSAKAHDIPASIAELCESEGGCKFISRAAMNQQLQRAYRSGQATCESKL